MKLRYPLRLMGATALAFLAAACGDQEKNATSPELSGPRLAIIGSSGIGNFVWHDLNANGIQDDREPGIGGAALTFVGPAGSGPVTVDPDGTYFINGPGGSYTICVALPSGFNAVSPKLQGSDSEKDSDGDGTAANCVTALLNSNQVRLDIDFGFYKTASLGDFVWYDANANGIQDPTETGIPNALVTLTGPSGPLSTNTGANGQYGFTSLKPGTYVVCADTPSGYSNASLPLQGGNPAKDSNGESSPNCSSVVLASGENNPTIDFGFTLSKASLGDRVWHDLNANGLQDANELGISGVTVNLTGPSGPLSTITDLAGIYGFPNLEPGSYTVCVPTAVGYTNRSAANQGIDGTIDSDGTGAGNCRVEVLSPGENNSTIDFGFYKLGAIGDFVWYDANSNGIQDGGETGIAGATVVLTGPGNVVSSQLTTGTGGYLFNNLTPGTYTVCVSTPSGYTGPTDDLVGADRAIDSNGQGSITPPLPNCDTKVLTSGEIDLKVDFGFVIVRAALGDFVWFDKNANGIQDAGEPGIKDANVTLTGPGGLSLNTLTNQDGGYAFSNLLPGAGYIVCVAKPAGYASISPANAGADNVDSDGVGANNCAPAVTLAAGDNNTTIDFGFYIPVELGDFVWHDLNANGVQDVGEPGIQGVSVTMTGPSGPATATTGPLGEYKFTGLTPGTYSVCVALPSGYTQFSPAGQGGDNAKDSNGPGTGGNCTSATVPSGTTDMTLDFGFYKLAALGDFVWADANANGVQDGGEVGIGSVGLTLTGPSGPQSGATTALGIYGFASLKPGTYVVCIPVKPVGYVGATDPFKGGDATKDSNGDGNATGNCATVTLVSGQTDITIDFGYTKAAVVLGSIGDFVWHDLNGNGVQDGGEPGIGGATVTLSGPGGAATTTTTAGGNYSFTGLAAGSYVVCAVKPAGYTGTSTAGLGGDVTKDSNGDGTATNCSAAVVLPAGGSNTTIDFGFYKLGAIGDYTWYDENNNGIQGSDEPALNGVTVTLSGASSGTQTTANGGKYLFTGLKPGSYTVCTTIPSGYHAVPSLQGADRAIDSNGSGTPNCSAVVVLSSGETNLTVDFGFDCGTTSPTTASVGNFVWNDKNGNGVQDAGEPGITGATVKLAGNGVSKTTTTNSSGNYLFTDLQPGTYTICVTTPNGLTVTGADKGGDDTKDSDALGSGNCASTTLGAGEQDLTIDFGFWCPPANTGSIKGFVWNDSNADGLQASNSVGINGRTVTLTSPSGSKTTTTDSYGKYLFANLPAGAYTICVAVPTGWAASPSNVGTNEGIDSDGMGAGNCATVALAAGENKVDPDFGLYCKPVTGSIGSYVWNDADKDGIQDSGESGIGGRTVTLTGAASKTTTTDSGGKYAFTGLGAGTYTVCVAAPSGYTATTADKGTDDNIDSDGKGTSNCATITLTAGQTNNTLDFGFYCTPQTGAIGGQAWYDKNFDGVQDGGYEVGLSGQTITLSGPGGSRSATTDKYGNYNFGNLAAGTYTVCGCPPKDYKASPANRTYDSKDSDGSGTNNCATITLSAGQTINTVDFGFDKKW